ncbi:hypothetical protein ACH48_11185 [Aeromonas caviae]|nr:hypothetical protein ACH48_11185 [Aeromonas caviae]
MEIHHQAGPLRGQHGQPGARGGNVGQRRHLALRRLEADRRVIRDPSASATRPAAGRSAHDPPPCPSAAPPAG